MARSALDRYWYVVAESRELKADSVLARRLHDESLALYRDATGTAIVAQDRCLHRCSRLSSGMVEAGKLRCRYHGWVYGEGGKVIHIPSDGEGETPRLKAKTYRSVEQDGYIYACLAPDAETPATPFVLPRPEGDRWRHIRLQNVFANSIANCAENYIDVPHTSFVHKGIFRNPAGHPIDLDLVRQSAHIKIIYNGETLNLGYFSRLLNPSGGLIEHVDNFHAPNITSVHYRLPNGFSYFITSQCVARSEGDTLVYTDISYDFGLWSSGPFDLITRWVVRDQAQRVINQDISILNEQGETIRQYGETFYNTTADAIHVEIHDMINRLERGEKLGGGQDMSRRLRIFV